MAVDPLSPIAPARIRALLLPVGRIKRSRFLAFVELLQPQCMVRLGDISPDPRPDRNMFNPLAFPGGTLLYDLSTSLPPPSHLSLSPFELFREPLLIIGIADATEYAWLQESHDEDEIQSSKDGQTGENADVGGKDLTSALEHVRDQFPKAYLHTVTMFDCLVRSGEARLPQGFIPVPPVDQQKTTTMKTLMCDITSKLLAEMTTLARSIQALPTLPSPASSVGDGTNGAPSWTTSDNIGSQIGRRNSQTTPSTRPGSPLAPNQKDAQRMSMPVLPSSSSSPAIMDDPRSSALLNQGVRTPPTTFDEMPEVIASSIASKSGSSNTKNPSGDRVSIHGFGSGGVGERARNKGRGRVSIAIGSLYLCAGQWYDALRDLTEGATRARAFSDHLWHAKALENILVCLLLFAWSGMDFQIPQICFPSTDKSSGVKSPQHTPSSSVADISVPPPTNTMTHDTALENLNGLIPDLVNMILNIYSRASNFAGESLPPLAFSECIIRFSKLLTAMNLSAGYLDDDALRHLVQNTPFRQKPKLSVPRLSVNPTRNDIASMLFRALPAQADASGLTPTDRVVVLAGIASVLSALGLQRKKAIIMKEFVTSLIPGLVQARKVGAAEMGVHPAAGLAALNIAGGSASGAGALNLGEGEVESGIEEFLGLLGRIYGIPGSRGPVVSHDSFPQYGSNGSPDSEPTQLAVQEILQTSSLRSFGSLALKIDILRMCINFCEALPDFNGVLHFTSLLLRIAGPGTAPKSNSTDVFVSIPRDEQARLFANITRTVAAANKLGLQQIETEYWDDFLVRGIQIMDEPLPLRLIHHRPAELKSTSAGKDGPFIHNPWLKRPPTSPTETILVANESYQLLIALQNPYDFELEIESLRIAANGVEFVGREQYFLLGPYRTQKFPIDGVARSAGTLSIKGCYVKVAGCRERLFPTFPDPWRPERENKMKKIGLTACLAAPVSRPTSTVEYAVGSISAVAPKPETLTFTVIPDQPLLAVTDVSLPQGALMVLEGERRRFTITLRNTSQTTPVDFIHITFQDSAGAALQTATTDKDLAASELHELEYQLAHLPSLRWCRSENDGLDTILPGSSATFEIEVVGRTRLTDATIQFDYANLGKRRSEIKERFFTRQLSVPISITVNASVQLQRPDIVPLSGDLAWTHRQSGIQSESAITRDPSTELISNPHGQSDTHFQTLLQHTRVQGQTDEYCMLLLDLRNSWPNPLSISLEVGRLPSDEVDSADYSWAKAYGVNEIIQPGHVNRVAIMLPKIYLKEPFASIPSLNPANQRQFVVSTSKISPDVERLSREAFWYRQELLKIVRGTWKEESNGRNGEIELRGIRFSARMVEAIKLDDVMFEVSIEPDRAFSSSGDVVRVGQTKFQVPVDEFLTMKTVIRNRSPRPIAPLLRLQPHLASLPHDLALDLDKRFSWTGVLQRKLPTLQPGQSVESELGIIALATGLVEIGATVEETELAEAPSEVEGNRPRGNSSLLQGPALGELKLRSWHLKEPCTILAKRSVPL